MATEYDFPKDHGTEPRQAEAPAATEHPAMQRAGRIVVQLAAVALIVLCLYFMFGEFVR
jgi:hypothetical protein